MPPRSFLTRLLLPFAALIVLTVSVCGGIVYWTGQRAVHVQQMENLNRLADLLTERSGTLSGENLPRLERLAHVLGTRVTVIDAEGTVLFDSDISAQRLENHNRRPEVIEARQSPSHIGTAMRYSETLDEDAVYVARLVEPADPQGWVIRLSYPRHTWVRYGPPVWLVVVLSCAAAALALGALALLLQRRWIGPTRQLAHVAEQMAGGDWSVRAAEQGADELRFFSTRLNILAQRAQEQLEQLGRQRGDLEALVDSLPSPIIVSDEQRRIVLVNAPAARLFTVSRQQALGQKFTAVVTEPALLELLDAAGSASGTQEFLRRDIRLTRNAQRQVYQAFAARTAEGGTLLVLRDISELATAVQMKTDFVANASHELRTPMAAMKAAFETLRDVYREDPQQAERCMQIVGGHLGRLEELLLDLLDLSRVESSELKLHLSELSAARLFDNLRSTLGPMAADKQVQLQLDATVQNFTADERLLGLIIKNLVENSIKFTPAGGKVQVRLERGADGDQVLLTVADTGIGIAPEHLDRVFERFYQVDAARSGAPGRGTGLGLAIVKHAVAAMGGTISLKSVVSEGTVATCAFPQVAIAPAECGGAYL